MRCPHCSQIDGRMLKRGYCSHCLEKVSASQLMDIPGADQSLSLPGDFIECPECGRHSDSIKCYRMGAILFLLVAWISWTESHLGCPSCIRRRIAKVCCVNVVTANLLWPIFVLPWCTILFIRSFARGHSQDVKDALNLQ